MEAEADGPAPEAADIETVLDALVLSGFRRGKTVLAQLLRALEWRRTSGRAFDADTVSHALRFLRAEGRAEVGGGEGYCASEQALAERLPQLLARPEASTWWRAVAHVASGGYGSLQQVPVQLPLRSAQEARAMLRLQLISGVDPNEYASRLRFWYGLEAVAPMRAALRDLIGAQAVERAHRATWWGLLGVVAGQGGLDAPLADWVRMHIDAERDLAPESLQLREAEARVHRGDATGLRILLAGRADSPGTRLFEAAVLAREGRWAEASEAFTANLKALATSLGRRRDLAPQSLLQWHLLALLKQPDPKAWMQARKLCVSESGKRQPSELDAWGRWVHAIDVRLGDARLIAASLDGEHLARLIPIEPDRAADGPILAAWIGQPVPGWSAERLQALTDALLKHDRPWKAELLRQACERLGLPAPELPAGLWPVQYFGAPTAAWRDALAAIVALGETRGSGMPAAQATLSWRLTLDEEGRVDNLEAYEPSATGRGKAKPVSPAALKRRTRMDPRDAAVARCLRSSTYGSDVCLDLSAAAQALVGHPNLALADAPEQAVELRESLPSLSVRRTQDEQGRPCFALELDECLLERTPPSLAHHLVDSWSGREQEIERRNSLRVVREAPDRARLIRVGAAQRRVAELAAQRWLVPADAGTELDAALRVLTGYFVVHSEAEAGEPVASDARLVAQLEPQGQALRLQLGVRPFGDFGPLLAPGMGRERLMTLHRGLSLSTLRELDAERAHLDALLARLPELGDEADARWLLDEPGLTLEVVERLGKLQTEAHPSLRALEWPRGRSLKVHAATGLKTKLSSGRDWFALSGELRVDEGRVVSLQALLTLLREQQGSRFVALGEGEYLALSEQLRQRMADLDTLAETEGERLRVGATAAGWLADAAEELGLSGDARWRERAQRLERAAALQPDLPAGLRADLRPYQQQGFEWLARLAAAGFGAILADDMGLGKTVQTLALLLHRAALGPALIVAPTSVCANWIEEAARFAPALRILDHAEGDRQLGQPGPGDVRVVSYALLLRDAEQFQAVEWSTLVLDEAQALKNAATQRVKAVAALPADFRIALSGTPVENRLADLWSLMNLLNPGLLGSANRFAERFGHAIERGRDAAARARLRRLVAPFLLRRTKAQVLTDLPPRTEIVHRVEPTAEERAFLDAARREALARIAQTDPDDGRRAFQVLAELTRLRRAACDPRLIAPELGMVGAKVQAFERLAQELVDGRHQTLVFSQFTGFLKLLAERLDAAGLRYTYLDGSTPAPQRAERVAAFQRGDADLFLMSLKAGGFGLNLTAADYVVIADPWWNPAAEDQAMGRAHRLGQQRPVTVYRLVTAGSVEERIVALHADKRELADGVLEGQDGGAPLPADALLDLLRDN